MNAATPVTDSADGDPDTPQPEPTDHVEPAADCTDNGSNSRSRRSWRVRRVIPAIAYLVVSYVVLYPILVSPVVADDYINPFVQADEGGTSLLDGLRFAWTGSQEGASFRPFGGLVGSLVGWSTLWLSATFDVGLTPLYFWLKYVLMLLCAMSIAWCWTQISLVVGRAISWFEALVFISIALFTTLQIHAYWSNDPVANYPLVGFGATTLGFVFLGLVVRFIRLKTIWSASAAAFAALAAVSYYELNVSAVVASSLVLGLFALRQWNDRGSRWTAIVGSLSIIVVPAVFVLAGRTVTGDQAESYGGTTVRLGGTALRTFGLGLASSLPGAAWRLSIETLGGMVGIVWFAIGVTVLITWIAAGRTALVRRGQDRSVPATSDRWLQGVIISMLVIYWFTAVAIQAITVKVQDETIRLGYVYTSYCVGAAVVAFGLAAAARSVFANRRLHLYLPVVGALAVSFVLVQQTVNWRLSEQLNASFVPNRQLLAAFDDSAPPPERCQALLAWTSGGWPDYYEVGMIDGLDVAYRYYFGEPFCDGFVRPP